MSYSSIPVATLLILCFLTACEQKEDSRDHDLTDPTEELTEQPKDSSTADNSPQQVIQRMYNAVNEKKYEQAYLLWDNNGKASGKTQTEFEQEYRQTAEANVSITGEVSTEGAAGSLYAEVPVRVEMHLESGNTQVFKGTYVLRKRNIDTDNIANSWHIYDAKLAEQ